MWTSLELKLSWQRRLCGPSDFDKENKNIATVSTLKKLNEKDFESVLFGGLPVHQKKGSSSELNDVFAKLGRCQ